MAAASSSSSDINKKLILFHYFRFIKYIQIFRLDFDKLRKQSGLNEYIQNSWFPVLFLISECTFKIIVNIKEQKSDLLSCLRIDDPEGPILNLQYDVNGVNSE